MGHKKQKRSKIFFVFAFLISVFSLNILPALGPAPTPAPSPSAQTAPSPLGPLAAYADEDDGEEGEEEEDDEEEGDDSGGTASSGSCYTEGTALSWIICPVIEALIGLTDWIYNDILTNWLQVDSNMFSSESGNSPPALEAWQYFQGFANILFIIFTLVVIFSQVTGIGVSNLGIKRILPRLIVAIFLVNLSYIICQLLVDVSNILGMSLKNLFDSIEVGSSSGEGSVLGAILGMIGQLFGVTVGLTALAVGAFALSGTMSVGLVITCIISLLPAIAGVFVLFALLAARQAGVLILTIIAPVAVVLYMLPNTKGIFNKYIRIFGALILLYPICGALMGGSDLAAKIILAANEGKTNDVVVFVALLIDTIPFFFIPTLVRRSMDSIAGLGSLATNWGSRAGRGAQSLLNNREGLQSALARSRAGLTIGRRKQFERDEHGNIKRDANGRRMYKYEKNADGSYKRDARGNKIIAREHQRNWSGENRKAISDANIPVMSRAMRRQQVRANEEVEKRATADAMADAVFTTTGSDGGEPIDMTQAAINRGQAMARGRARRDANWADKDFVAKRLLDEKREDHEKDVRAQLTQLQNNEMRDQNGELIMSTDIKAQKAYLKYLGSQNNEADLAKAEAILSNLYQTGGDAGLAAGKDVYESAELQDQGPDNRNVIRNMIRDESLANANFRKREASAAEVMKGDVVGKHINTVGAVTQARREGKVHEKVRPNEMPDMSADEFEAFFNEDGKSDTAKATARNYAVTIAQDSSIYNRLDGGQVRHLEANLRAQGLDPNHFAAIRAGVATSAAGSNGSSSGGGGAGGGAGSQSGGGGQSNDGGGGQSGGGSQSGGGGAPGPNSPNNWQGSPFAQYQPSANGGASGANGGAPGANSPENWQNSPLAQQQASSNNASASGGGGGPSSGENGGGGVQSGGGAGGSAQSGGGGAQSGGGGASASSGQQQVVNPIYSIPGAAQAIPEIYQSATSASSTSEAMVQALQSMQVSQTQQAHAQAAATQQQTNAITQAASQSASGHASAEGQSPIQVQVSTQGAAPSSASTAAPVAPSSSSAPIAPPTSTSASTPASASPASTSVSTPTASAQPASAPPSTPAASADSNNIYDPIPSNGQGGHGPQGGAAPHGPHGGLMPGGPGFGGPGRPHSGGPGGGLGGPGGGSGRHGGFGGPRP